MSTRPFISMAKELAESDFFTAKQIIDRSIRIKDLEDRWDHKNRYTILYYEDGSRLLMRKPKDSTLTYFTVLGDVETIRP